MIVADRKVAIVPLEAAPEHIEVAAVVHPSALLDGLIMLFELIWEHADPLGDPRSVQADRRRDGQLGADQPNGSDETKTLLTLLAAGLTDKAVARQLG